MPNLVPVLTLRNGRRLPRLGLGTWRMGESQGSRAEEVRVLRHAIDQGITLIDTAEMYGEGGAEEVVGEAIRGQRDKLLVISKVYPWNASRRGTIAACERSLKRLGTDAIDLYLLHWRGEHPLADTVAAFEQLRREGKILGWGVSNFDTADLQELVAIEHGEHCVVNQVYYSLAARWPEATLLPRQRAQGVVTMAYSPLDQGRLAKHPTLRTIGRKHGASAAQVALAWLLSREDIAPIPKSARREGVDEILGALRLGLDQDDRSQLEKTFPPPRGDARMQTT